MANISIRVDDTLKQQSERVLDEIGLNMTTAVTAFLKQVVRVGGIPFDLRADPYQAFVERALDEADAEAERNVPRIPHEEFVREMRAYLDELSRQSNHTV